VGVADGGDERFFGDHVVGEMRGTARTQAEEGHVEPAVVHGGDELIGVGGGEGDLDVGVLVMEPREQGNEVKRLCGERGDGADRNVASQQSGQLVDGTACACRGGERGARVGQHRSSGVGLFGLGSLLAGLAPSIGTLAAARVLQGVGPALLVPGSLTIIRAVFTERRQRAVAVGLWSTSSGIALALGPPLGGVLVAAFGWRAVFLFNLPLAAALLTLGARYMPRLPLAPVLGRFDWPGAALSTAALGLLSVGVIEGQAHGWTAAVVLGAFGAGALALAGFVWVERRRAAPLIDLSLFSDHAFSVANLAASVVFFAFVGAIVYLSAYFQQVQGHGPIAAGVDVVAIGVAYAAATVLSGRIVARAGESWPLTGGLILSGLATLGLLRLQPTTGIGAIWWNFALLGGGIGLCGTPMSTIAISAVGPDRAGMASAVINAVRQVGQVFGVAVLGALVYAQLPGGTATNGRLTPARQALFVAGLHSALWVCGLALLAAALPVAALFFDHSTKRQQPAARRALTNGNKQTSMPCGRSSPTTSPATGMRSTPDDYSHHPASSRRPRSPIGWPRAKRRDHPDARPDDQPSGILASTVEPSGM
jgi:MFS transporter, DHA2 family, methylenomycin A resistance protein